LREVAVMTPDEPEWQLQVTGLAAPALSLDTKSKRWRLASPGVDGVDTREGVIGTRQIESHRWPVPAGRGAPIVPIVAAGDRALAIEPRADLIAPITNPFGGLMFALSSAPRLRSTMWALGPDGAVDLGTSRLELTCQRLSAGGVCQIFDATRTRFFTMDAMTHAVSAAASLPGRFFSTGESQGQWISGWYRSALVAVRLAPADAIQVVDPGGGRPHMLIAAAHAAAGVWYRIPVASAMRVDPYGQATTCLVRIYAVD
jgi:hypothetical protein